MWACREPPTSPTPQVSDHNSESVAQPRREQAFFTSPATGCMLEPYSLACSQKSLCPKDSLCQWRCVHPSGAWGLCLGLLPMPVMPSMVTYKQLLHEHSMMEWALLLSFSCRKNHPLYLGNPIAWIFIGSAFTVSGRKEDSTVREKDAFGWQIL